MPHTRTQVERDDTDYAGTRLTVTWGKEHFQPERFIGFDVGPFTMETTVREGETPLEASRRCLKVMEQMAEDDFRTRHPKYMNRVERSRNRE